MVTLVTIVATVWGLTSLTGNRAAALMSQSHVTKDFHKAKNTEFN